MPPIFLHMASARGVVERLGRDEVTSSAGVYYLGATSPDIRVLTRDDRERTHFFNLHELGHQDSVARLFEEHPHLQRAERLDPDTALFVAGYANHLILDETWIVDVYRPHFGQLSALGGGARADIMDRVLQYELDRRCREDEEGTAAIRAALEGSSLAINVGFLDSDTLRRWRDVAVDMTRHPPTWERFRYQGGRHLRSAGIDSEEELSEFMQRVPQVLEETIRHVSTAHVDAYLERSANKAYALTRQYLGLD